MSKEWIYFTVPGEYDIIDNVTYSRCKSDGTMVQGYYISPLDGEPEWEDSFDHINETVDEIQELFKVALRKHKLEKYEHTDI